MDATAKILAAVRVGEPVAEFIRMTGGTGVTGRPTASRHKTTASFRVVLAGSCWVVPHPDAPRSFAPLLLESGDMALFGPGVAHAVSAADPADRTTSGTLPADEVLSLYGGYLMGRRQPHPMLLNLPDISHIPMRASCPIEFQSMITMVGNELDGRPTGSAALTPPLIDAVMMYVLRTWLLHREQDRTWSPAHADPSVARALSVIHERMQHPWTVAELAAVAGLSRAAFARRFTKLVGQPPLTYLTQMRLARAARLLCETDQPIATIADNVGYGSQIALTRAFRREEGVTPGSYRTQRA
jgi:AraC-like DNA-binding protein